MQYSHSTKEQLIDLARHSHWGTDLTLFKNALEEIQSTALKALAMDTATSLLELGFGKNAVIAALLQFHDPERVEEKFGNEILQIVNGVQKIESVKNKTQDKLKPEDLQHLILAITTDPRMLIVWIAKKLQELRFVSEQPREVQTRLAESALYVWVPIIHKLGLHKIRWEIEDLAMKKIMPREYKSIKEHINDKRNLRQQKMENLVLKLDQALHDANIQAAVFGRVKNFYRIYHKMLETHRKLSEIHDLIGARIICNSVNECYETLAIIQNAFKIETGGYDDYIAKPKKTGYRSIHVNLNWKGVPAEIQIRTWDMHKEAEEGIAAHWEYKQYQKDPKFDQHLTLAKQLSDWFDQTKNKTVMDSLNFKFEKTRIFVLTPKNEPIELPKNATPVDFAFAVHSELGFKCEKARVNGKIVPLDHHLQTGDVVEIITSEKQVPKQNWLTFVQTEKARQKIRARLSIAPKSVVKKEVLLPKQIAILRKNAQLFPARCCSPLPGDEVVGHKTTKRKIKIHRSDCPNAKRIPEDERIYLNEVKFDQKEFETFLKVTAQNKPGILSDILETIAKTDAKIASTEATTNPHSVTCKFRIKTQSRKTIEQTLERIKKIAGVTHATRA